MIRGLQRELDARSTHANSERDQPTNRLAEQTLCRKAATRFHRFRLARLPIDRFCLCLDRFLLRLRIVRSVSARVCLAFQKDYLIARQTYGFFSRSPPLVTADDLVDSFDSFSFLAQDLRSCELKLYRWFFAALPRKTS